MSVAIGTSLGLLRSYIYYFKNFQTDFHCPNEIVLDRSERNRNSQVCNQYDVHIF